MSDFGYLRERMVQELAADRGIQDARVLEAMRRVPRHRFVQESTRTRAYGDSALPIGADQTISQPYIVARMTELLAVEPSHSVLEVGTGSGYQTAILACLARRVFSFERIPALARAAIQRIRELELDNVKIQAFDGTVGWSDRAPFDRIMVTAGAPKVPAPLLEQLANGGRLVIPEGSREEQELILYQRRGNRFRRNVGEPVAFVPLVGRHGWQETGR